MKVLGFFPTSEKTRDKLFEQVIPNHIEELVGEGTYPYWESFISKPKWKNIVRKYKMNPKDIIRCKELWNERIDRMIDQGVVPKRNNPGYRKRK